jgi:hypothetical protein
LNVGLEPCTFLGKTGWPKKTIAEMKGEKNVFFKVSIRSGADFPVE